MAEMSKKKELNRSNEQTEYKSLAHWLLIKMYAMDTRKRYMERFVHALNSCLRKRASSKRKVSKSNICQVVVTPLMSITNKIASRMKMFTKSKEINGKHQTWKLVGIRMKSNQKNPMKIYQRIYLRTTPSKIIQNSKAKNRNSWRRFFSFFFPNEIQLLKGNDYDRSVNPQKCKIYLLCLCVIFPINDYVV